MRKNNMSMIELRQLLETGIILKHVAAASGYSISALSIFCRAWDIKRKTGPRPKPVVPTQAVR
jgi:hypothetical protein